MANIWEKELSTYLQAEYLYCRMESFAEGWNPPVGEIAHALIKEHRGDVVKAVRYAGHVKALYLEAERKWKKDPGWLNPRRNGHLDSLTDVIKELKRIRDQQSMG